jgi:ABC-type lipoprotein release transport system permease subunit
MVIIISSCLMRFIIKEYHSERLQLRVHVHVEANEPSLENKRIKRDIQYATKLKAYPSNHANDVFLILYIKIFMKNSPIQFNLLDFEENHTLKILM